MFAGGCMNCAYRKQARCSFRPPYSRANNVDLPLPASNIIQVVGPISERTHINVPFPVDKGSVPSSTSTRSKQHGPEYSTKWYKTPLDNISLAQDINGMIAVCEDLHGGSEEETLEDDKPNPFYDSNSEHGDDDTSSLHARSENDGSEVGSVDVGSLGVGSVDLNSDVVDDVDDVDSDVSTSDIDE
ncbi:hypothetical protein N7527_011564 [Penicillium freii]|nr:hypothetical protein N7527_011564 [Penicillium freii]